MDSHIETLKELLTKKDKAIKECESRIQSLENDLIMWKHEMDSLGHQWAGISEAIKALQPPELAASPAPGNKYTEMGLTDAVMDILELSGKHPGLLPREILEKLESQGFISTAKNLYSSVYGVCLGLVKQGRIQITEKDHKRSFFK